VHAAAHLPVHVDALGADFFTCSPYKFLGPHCGVLAAAPAVLDGLRPQKLLPSPDVVPERFELGTLPYELLAGTTAAIDFLAGFGTGESRRDRLVTALGAIGAHEDRLRERIEDGLARLPGVTVLSRAAHRTPTLLVTFAGREPAAAYAFLAERGVHAPRAPSTPSSRRAASASATPGRCGSASRPTSTTPTSSGCSRASRSSCGARRRTPGRGARAGGAGRRRCSA
jgi:selenocysteine lyase/cysteine desulfurase